MEKGLRAIPLFLYALIGLVCGILVEWLAYNIIWNYYSITAIMEWIYLIVGITLIIVGFALLLYHHASGMLVLVLGIKMLNWALSWLIPIYDVEYGEWFNWGWGWL
jgi:uncharacterized protein YacL